MRTLLQHHVEFLSTAFVPHRPASCCCYFSFSSCLPHVGSDDQACKGLPSALPRKMYCNFCLFLYSLRSIRGYYHLNYLYGYNQLWNPVGNAPFIVCTTALLRNPIRTYSVSPFLCCCVHRLPDRKAYAVRTLPHL